MFRRSLLAAAMLVITAVLSPALPTPPSRPGRDQVPANKQFLGAHAIGVQIYAGPTGWTFVAPRANLYDHRGRLIITHFAGPTWQAKDGSKVVGKLAASTPATPRRSRGCCCRPPRPRPARWATRPSSSA